MKLVTRVKLTGALLAGVVLTLASVAANAANTTAGTSIANRATVNYSVGGVAQTAIGSSSTGNTTGAGSDTTFLVDDKVAVNVTTLDTSIVSVTPGLTTAVTAYTVTNNGNATQKVYAAEIFELSGTANPFASPSGTSDFAISSAQTYVDTNTNGVYDAGTDTLFSGFLATMAPGTSKTVFLVSTIPSTQVDGDFAVVGLQAQAGDTAGASPYASDDSASAWDPTTVQVIFAEGTPNTNHDAGDAANDGKSTDLDAYLVSSSKLTITKNSSVVTDPVHCTTAGNVGSCTGSNFKAIPGSVMKYTLTVANGSTATANASAISVADDLTSQITTNSYTAWFTGGMTVTTPGVNTGSSFPCADDGATTTTQAATGGAPYTAVTCDYNKTAATTVSVSGITLKPGDTATVTYEVTIQ